MVNTNDQTLMAIILITLGVFAIIAICAVLARSGPHRECDVCGINAAQWVEPDGIISCERCHIELRQRINAEES